MKARKNLFIVFFVCATAAVVQAQTPSNAPQQRGGGGRGSAPGVPFMMTQVGRLVSGAWWTNTALVTQLGLTDEQKSKIEQAFENHRQTLAADSEQVNKEEAQLARLLEADPIDRNAILAQIDVVAQTRSELERANSAMTLEMREALTRAQWMQLQSRPIWLNGLGAIGTGAKFQVSPPQPGQRGTRGTQRPQQ